MMREYGRNPNHFNVKFYEFKGERRTISDWAKRFGLPYTTIEQRLRRGVDKPKSRAGRPPCSSRPKA
jgi:cytochrome oxidase Cu insertion factor (SCO1/SenC/PrrC family)